MKIVFFAKATPGTPSTNYRCRFLGNKLRERGHTVQSIFPLDLSTNNRLLDKLYRLAIFEHRTRKLIKHRDADVLFIQGTPYRPEAVSQLWLLKKALGKPMIFNFDDANYLDRPYITKWLVQLADRVIVPSKRLKEYARCFSTPVDELPLGVNTDAFKPTEKRQPAGTLRTVWFGNTTSHIDNLKFLRDVFRHVSPETATLTVFGNKTERLRELFGDLDRQCTLAGYREQEKLITELQQADLGLVPIEDTLWANSKYPVKTVEMLASGLPVLASSNSEASRIVRDGVSGYTLDNDPKTWADRITSIETGSSDFRSMQKSARREALEHYSMEKVADRALDVFTKLLKA